MLHARSFVVAAYNRCHHSWQCSCRDYFGRGDDDHDLSLYQ